ncbi:hypothetical protein NPX13_g8244 [Xylaria arbuscula]|uniref:Heterokaryon incompatibility domain-containing protein n=1 Tax=Xylaria arbuscula TaxID=114810 RepID=A0A9W8N918_9PEZI|nr:hypothetical protein NPX13_g8244 [Xylaria arbuscula]
MCSAFGDGFAHSRTEVTGPELDPKSCDFCCLIWHSMSLGRRRSLVEVAIHGIEDRFNGSYLPLPTDPSDALRLKIWEERPLSPYTYTQLYWGEIAIGARILIHREKLFAEPSLTVDQARTSSSQHFAQAREWVRSCSENHHLCNGITGDNPELPARLLYVCAGENWQPGDQPAILKLVRTADLDRRPEYLAFSHCWGAPEGMQFKLLASNIERCYEQIEFNHLSKNMQDAIIATLTLAISPYIWIDSLCIIQKDEREDNEDMTWKSDWDIEARKMGGVYSGAVLTIASTGSSSSDGGCFHARNTQSLRPVKIGVSSLNSPDAEWIFARADDVFDFERNVNLAPLNTRGWVMQERLLSRRILHFGAEMIYWECRRRSASEFNPHGYTYKSYPEDFEDWYVPNVGEFNTRRDIERGEREGRGVSWAGEESVRQRPPPVMTDPDTEAASFSARNGEWQRRRGFWKDVLKRTDGPWSADEIAKEKGHRSHSGFRPIFEALRSKQSDNLDPYAWAMYNHSNATEKPQEPKDAVQVGRGSFSQRWYDIVESYSRGKLTVPADKLMALKGIQDEISSATGFTYLYGLWRESLITDMLWFAIEGPGKRLRNNHGIVVGPTWSWVSIDAPVALDLLPENSRGVITLKQRLITILDLGVLGDVCSANGATNPEMPSIELCGWTFPLSRRRPDLQQLATGVNIDADADVWEISVSNAKTMQVKVFFDTDAQDVLFESSFTCLPFLILERKAADTSGPSRSNDTQGLVMRLVRMREGYKSLDVYERVGYFTTSYMPTSRGFSDMQAAVKSSAGQRLRLAG